MFFVNARNMNSLHLCIYLILLMTILGAETGSNTVIGVLTVCRLILPHIKEDHAVFDFLFLSASDLHILLNSPSHMTGRYNN